MGGARAPSGSARGVSAALLLSALCACSDGAGAKLSGYLGDGSFGTGYQEPDAAGGDTDTGDAPPDDGGFEGTRVRLRVLQGVINLRAAYLCHDPDYDVDAAEAGEEPPVELSLELGDAGALQPGDLTAYASLPGMTRGAITVHRAPNLDGGGDGAVWDGAAPDASSDAALDGPAPDGDMDAARPQRCDPASLEAILPLPLPNCWVDLAREDIDASTADGAVPEAGPTAEARGFVATASGGDTLTLFGSGLLLQSAELKSRIDGQRQRYLEENPGDTDGADAWARRQERILEATYGPRFLLSRAVQARTPGRFALLFSHLIPDVPQLQGRADAGSGALHLCVTTGTMEGGELSDAGAGFEFRNYSRLSDDLDPAQAYRFRVFIQAEYEQEQKTCATTSLKPVAELLVDAGTFAAGSSYSLVAWGARFPESICTTSTPGTLVRPGCELANNALRARLQIIDNGD
jgi:hypothetical protein